MTNNEKYQEILEEEGYERPRNFVQITSPLRLIIFSISISMVILTSACLESDVLTISPGYKVRTISELRSAHKYHGILYSYQKSDHKWYFTRNGQECRLFAYKENKLCGRQSNTTK